MEKQLDAGLTKSIGISNFNIKQITRILENCRIRPANLQIELHAYNQQKELVAFCKKNGITVTGYSPLGSPGLGKLLAKLGKTYVPSLMLYVYKTRTRAGEKERSSTDVFCRKLLTSILVYILCKN